ncbi:MAG: SHOCT domain-containing protein [Solirubrobacterales bacterium]
MTIDVERPGGRRYEIHDRWLVVGEQPISVGSELAVRVDRSHHRRVAIDWEATRQVYLERTAERGRRLATGVPVPVTRVKEILEQQGLEHPPAPPPERVPGRAAPQLPVDAKPAKPLTRGRDALLARPAEDPPETGDAGGEATGEDDDLIARLERLAGLHESGALTDDEFHAVKAHLLG